MVAMTLITAGGSAVVVPGLLGGVIGKLPGGPIAPLLAGAALIWLGSTMDDGMAKAVVVGAGAGLIIGPLLAMVFSGNGGKTA